MLSNKDINDKFMELIRKKENVTKIKTVIRETISQIGIKFTNEESEQIEYLESLIEKTGQFRVLKKDYIDTWNALYSLLKTAGYSTEVIECLTESLRFENWNK